MSNKHCGPTGNLTDVECAAWQDMCGALGSKNWPGWRDAYFWDPCAFKGHVSCEIHPPDPDENDDAYQHNSTHITRFYLGGPNLKGVVPPSFSNLTHLTHIVFGNSQLEGPMPGLTKMANLIDLWLENNKLTGPAPALNYAQLGVGPSNKCQGASVDDDPEKISTCCGIGGTNRWDCPLPAEAISCNHGGKFLVHCAGSQISLSTEAFVMGIVWGVGLVSAVGVYFYRLWKSRNSVGKSRCAPLGADMRSPESSRHERIYQLLQHEMQAPPPTKSKLAFQLFVLVYGIASFVWAIDRVVYDLNNNQTCGGADSCTFHAFVLACAVLTSAGSTWYSYSQYRKMRRKVDDLQQGVVSDAVLDSLGTFFLRTEFSRRAREGRGLTDMDCIIHTLIDIDDDASQNSTTDFVAEEFDDSSAVFTSAQLREATNGFHERNKLDEGAFGAVYRGKIDGDMEVAIKILKLERYAKDANSRDSKYSGKQSFVREAKLLARYRHPNLVALLGHCKGEDTMPQPALIFEFMTGGSLEERLMTNKLQQRHPPLAVADRLQVASDTARGLAFLHGGGECGSPLVHQDIKPANILLGVRVDGDTQTLVAKLADFGLARLAPELVRDSVSHVSTQTTAGTLPYMPPEFVMSRRVSTKTDSFALGVVLMQLVTAKPPFHPVTRELLVDELHLALEDPVNHLAEHVDDSVGTWAPEASVGLVRIASRCLQPQPHRRTGVIELVPELDALAGRAAVDLEH